MKLPIILAAQATLLAAGAIAAPAPQAACSAQSGPHVAALVELYTSEGCSSCPPADHDLRHLDRLLDAGAAAIPLALHVDYWDALGWKDPYAQPAFADRQERLVHANQHAVVYTPHFFVNGQELRAGSAGLRAAVQAANAVPAQASIAAATRWTPAGQLHVDVSARTSDAVGAANLTVALAQNGLVSAVARGENRGARLEHDHVARAWTGALPLSAGAIRLQRDFALPPGAGREGWELVAFVEDAGSGRILQSLRAPSCSAAALASAP